MRIWVKFLIILYVSLCFGIYAEASGCGNCHGTPPGDRSHRIHSGLDLMHAAYGDTGYTQQYAPSAPHSYGFNCGNCHPLNSAKHRNGVVDIELSNKGAGGLRALNSNRAEFDSKKKRCSGVYCHSDGERGRNLRYVRSPRWNGKERRSRCQECHGSPPVYESTKERPNGHFNAARSYGHLLGIHWDSVNGHTKESFKYNTATQMGCTTCHFETVRRDTDMTFVDTKTGLFTCVRCHEMRDGDIYNYSVHVNGKVDLAFEPVNVRSKAQMMYLPEGWKRKGLKGKIESYDEAMVALTQIKYDFMDRSCSNVSCHLQPGKVFWYDKINCADCHVNFGAAGQNKRR